MIRRRLRLERDTRGAIAIMGIMFGVILVAALFQLTNSGFGILWREHAQDAADATAYEAALWNARGMNMVVALNIFIALVMAVLVAWRLIILFLMALTVTFAIACPFESQFCGYVRTTTQATERMLDRDEKIAGRVYQIIDMLHDTQKIVAAATPVMGSLNSVLEARRYADVEFGIGFGTQLIPSIDPPRDRRPTGSCVARQVASSVTADLADRLGTPISLPVVEEGDLHTLCGKAGELQILFLFHILDKAGEQLGLGFLSELGSSGGGGSFGKAWGSVTSRAANFFCGDFLGIAEDIADEACQGDETCTQTAVDALPERVKGGLKVDSSNVRFAEMWSSAVNGNLFMQSWSYVRTNRRYVDKLDRVVRLADLFGAGAEPTGLDPTGSTLAQAEMFFDCESGWSDASCSGQAAWAMRWQARLRRLRDPVDYASSTSEDDIVGGLYGGLAGAFVGQIRDQLAPVGEAVARHVRLVQVRSSTEFREQRAGLARDLTTADGSIENAATWVQQQVEQGVPELIH